MPQTPIPTLSARDPRKLTGLDRLIGQLDQALKSVAGPHTSTRAYPAADVPETELDAAQRREIAGLMRVNHSGEVAAQALYHGQALASKAGSTREAMVRASDEERDHLAWCATRIDELGGRTSALSPVWYAGSFAIGMLAGMAGDRASLGFLAETEKQVVEHLDSHLRKLPQGDARTRAVIEQMKKDEAEHGNMALNAGGILLPSAIRVLMKSCARVMTRTARWI
jgi:ubiquinone biosynthesis monooxygenase Coq7